ncbi:MAG: aspartyl protease family protein [Microscillaceae bacterium]|jgi:clan AA aspartic protease|nr:aspartyl protease family protein [Microscillaceae bacterium]
MGLIRTEIELLNSDDIALSRKSFITKDQIKKMAVAALVDTGAFMLAINENVKAQLDLRVIEEKVTESADGSPLRFEIVGPVEVRFKNRRTSVDAMVLPGNSEGLLGVIPLEGLDVVLNPLNQTIEVNPESPNFAKKLLK